MLDFAHDDRLFPRLAPQAETSRASRQPAHESRADKVARLKAQIQDGSYLTDAKLDAALDRMIAVAKR